eukprot:1159648-Pelagomonas_calceolata.AAC.4
MPVCLQWLLAGKKGTVEGSRAHGREALPHFGSMAKATPGYAFLPDLPDLAACRQASIAKAKQKDAELVALRPHHILTDKDLAKSVSIVLQETQTEFMLEIPSELYEGLCEGGALAGDPVCHL